LPEDIQHRALLRRVERHARQVPDAGDARRGLREGGERQGHDEKTGCEREPPIA
jgi:hypothetical protein